MANNSSRCIINVEINIALWVRFQKACELQGIRPSQGFEIALCCVLYDRISAPDEPPGGLLSNRRRVGFYVDYELTELFRNEAKIRGIPQRVFVEVVVAAALNNEFDKIPQVKAA